MYVNPQASVDKVNKWGSQKDCAKKMNDKVQREFYITKVKFARQ